MKKISVVVPCYNEESSLPLFYKELSAQFEKGGIVYELLLIDDGSTDETFERIKEIQKKDDRVRAFRFSRNFGQQAAILCGLKNASGDAVLTMDADLQDPPEVALQMIEKWKEGAMIVHARHKKRKGEGLFKKATASAFYRIFRKITKLNMPKDVGDFKLCDRKVVDEILSLPEHDRLYRAQTAWVGFSQAVVEFDRPKRVAGKTHYGLKKMGELAEKGILSNAKSPLTMPLKLGGIGLLLSVACFVVFAVLTAKKIAFGGLTAWLFPTVAFFASLILFCSGISNLYLSMVYREVQNRPKYIVSEEIGEKNEEK